MFGKKKKILHYNNIVNQTTLKTDFYLYIECYIHMLKAHQQISKKWCFGKYCSNDKACQFSAL